MKKLIVCLCLVISIGLIPLNVSAQVDFREETIYFLLTTRFFDGDPSNNAPTEWSSYHPDPNINQGITDPNDVTWRGDFKGLIQKLDYIKDLGFTAIWITPIVHNRSPLDYHGYHAWDFTKVDPRLESTGATFQDLINEVHARDMKIVLDIVTNHSGRFGIKDVAEIKYNTDPNQPWGQDSNGDPLQDNPDWAYDGITPNPDDGKIWSRANLAKMPPPYNSDLSLHQWPSKESYVDTSDPDWYHHSGNGFAQGFDDLENLQNRALAGDTPDLNTGSPTVRNYLVAAYTTFINMGVDAFRWDTMKHMSREDVLYFYDAFKAVNPDLFIFGEVAQKRHELHNLDEINPHYYTWRGDVNNSEPSGIAVIDFFAEATFHGVFEEGNNFSNVAAAARYDHLYADPSYNLTWLDNHDFGPNNDWNRRFGGSTENLAACMNFMFTWRGIPIVYYGTEVEFQKGVYADIHDASGITKSIDETGRAYFGNEFDNAPNHVIYQHIKKLNAIRKAVPALQKGSWRWDGNGGGNGIGFVRQSGSSEVAVGLAKGGGVTFNFSGLTNGIYRDAVTGDEISVNNGAMSFHVEPGSAGIYVLNGPGRIGGNGVGFFQPGSGFSQPVVNINPAPGNYQDPISVSMSASGGNTPISIYYTTDGSTPSSSSAVYSGSFNVDTDTTVKAIAIDSDGNTSPVVSNYYTFGEIQGLTVYFKKPSGWGTANVHYWNFIPAGAISGSNWPGPSMTPAPSEGTDWYQYTFQNVTSTNLLFDDNGGSQTVDLFRDKTGWYKDGVWYDTNPETQVNQAPTLTISPAGGTFVEGDVVSVILSATDDSGEIPSIFYTLDGTAPSSASIPYGSPIDLTDDTTLKAIAIDNEGLSSAESTHTFAFNPPASGLTVHFKPSGYIEPEIYFWNVTPSGQSTSWPGETMIPEGDGWYLYTFEGADCANMIFSDNGNTQTVDLNRCNNEGWYTEGQWSDTKPLPPAGLTIHFKKPSGWTTANIHYYNVSPAGITSTNWPGFPMNNDGNGWWSYTIEGANCADIVFNDSGMAQTADLSRCGEGWYDNGWYGSQPSVRTMSGSYANQEIKEITKPEKIVLSQNYPNPFKKSTTIEYELPNSQYVSLSVINILGEKVKELIHDKVPGGRHQVILDVKDLRSGIYFYELRVNNQVLRKRMVITDY
ncbi:starch-binding protein [Fulvivirga sp. 29W222]|uniref:Starch-binding protein n=1 Tax=Fulvivirga marina TaxID=2494733 RepID=A0A937G0M0_9BACT|nr:starch-binding protein [Fulvivirga marina]MBL6449620.1 starch-binding protein [Fulvivirga marina]